MDNIVVVVFVDEVQPKPSSLFLQQTIDSPLQHCNRFRVEAMRRLPLQTYRFVLMVTTAVLLSYLWGGPGYRVWHELYPILLNTTQSYRNRTRTNIRHIFNKLHLGKYSAALKSCANLHVHQTWVVAFAALSRAARRSVAIPAIPNSVTPLAAVHPSPLSSQSLSGKTKFCY